MKSLTYCVMFFILKKFGCFITVNFLPGSEFIEAICNVTDRVQFL